MAYFVQIKCIFTAYLLHMLCIFLHIMCIFWASICIFCACNLHICYVYVMAYFVHILVWNCISNAYSSSAGPRDGQVPGCSDFFRVPIPFRSYGSAKSCSCFHSYLQMIKKESSTNVPSFQSSRNIQDEGVQVAYCAYICIYMYSVNYIAYTCVFGHIDLFLEMWQNGLIGQTQRWSTSGRRTSKCFTFCPSHTSWESSPWSLLGTREPFRTACAESRPNFPERRATQSPTRVMGAGGGTSTRGQWFGRPECRLGCSTAVGEHGQVTGRCLFKLGRRLRMAAEAAHGGRSRAWSLKPPVHGGRSRRNYTRSGVEFPECSASSSIASYAASTKHVSVLLGDSRNDLLTQMQLHNHLCPISRIGQRVQCISRILQDPCIPSRYHRNPLKAGDISVQEFVVWSMTSLAPSFQHNSDHQCRLGRRWV